MWFLRLWLHIGCHLLMDLGRYGWACRPKGKDIGAGIRAEMQWVKDQMLACEEGEESCSHPVLSHYYHERHLGLEQRLKELAQEHNRRT